VCFASCFDVGVFAGLCEMDGATVQLTPQPDELQVERIADLPPSTSTSTAASTSTSASASASSEPEPFFPSASISSAPAAADASAAANFAASGGIVRRAWCGQYAVSSDDMSGEIVGGKSLNLAGLRGKLPDDILLPAQVRPPTQASDARENSFTHL